MEPTRLEGDDDILELDHKVQQFAFETTSQEVMEVETSPPEDEEQREIVYASAYDSSSGNASGCERIRKQVVKDYREGLILTGGDDILELEDHKVQQFSFETPSQEVMEVETSPPEDEEQREIVCASACDSSSGNASGCERIRKQVVTGHREGLILTLKQVGENLGGRKTDQFTQIGEVVASKLRFLHDNGHMAIIAKLENGIYNCLQQANVDLMEVLK